MGTHSKTGASGMHRWSVCPGSVALSDTVPAAPSSSYAKEGTAAHTLGEMSLNSGMTPHHFLGKKIDTFEVDTEMADAVEVYFDFCNGLLGHRKWVEYQFDVSKKLKTDGAYGTADYVLYNQETKILWVVDYKHGVGIPVEVENNPQLKYYALGALMALGLPVKTVKACIVQPRCGHPAGPVRVATLTAMEILDFSAELIDAIEATRKPDAILKAGDHCRFCPAQAVCPEFGRKATELAVVAFTDTEIYDPVELKRRLDWLPALKSWIKSIEEFSYNEANHGRCPPGYKLVAKRNQRQWKIDPEHMEVVAKELETKVADLFESKVISPAQAEKKFKSKKEQIAALVEKKSSGTTLARVDDLRPAVTTDAVSEFEKGDLLL